ncbi:MAG: three-helix bundle dimerization domain-containing protein [Chloroflexota bacterium]
MNNSGDNHGIINEADLAGLVDETVIEAIWSDLEGRVDREQVRQVALDVAQDFADATVTSFVPLFIRRRTYERLKLLVE